MGLCLDLYLFWGGASVVLKLSFEWGGVVLL